MTRGEDIYKEADKAAEQSNNSADNEHFPFRFFLGKGESREVLVLDESLEECVAFYEHNKKNPKTGYYDIYEPCPREFENCPLCEAGEKSYYVTYLTILDLTPYTNKNGDTVKYSRKLLPIKHAQLGSFKKAFNACMNNNGKLRGMTMWLERGKEKTAPRVGEPAPYDSGMLFEFIDEEGILEEFGHEQGVRQDGTVYEEANAKLKPFDYEKLFPKPSAAKLRKKYGGTPPAGGSEENDAAWGDSEEEEKPEPRGRSRRGRSSKEEEEEDVPFID
jgi:hypothetical protein